MICNALLRPNFHLLLDIAATFGLDRLVAQWDALRQDIPLTGGPADIAQLHRAAPIVDRCLCHMQEAVQA